MFIIQDILYPSIKLVDMFPLSCGEQVNLINTFHSCYFDTAQPIEDFAVEFQRVVANILSSYVPIELENLIEFQPIILESFNDSNKQKLYEEAIRGVL